MNFSLSARQGLRHVDQHESPYNKNEGQRLCLHPTNPFLVISSESRNGTAFKSTRQPFIDTSNTMSAFRPRERSSNPFMDNQVFSMPSLSTTSNSLKQGTPLFKTSRQKTLENSAFQAYKKQPEVELLSKRLINLDFTQQNSKDAPFLQNQYGVQQSNNSALKRPTRQIMNSSIYNFLNEPATQVSSQTPFQQNISYTAQKYKSKITTSHDDVSSFHLNDSESTVSKFEFQTCLMTNDFSSELNSKSDKHSVSLGDQALQRLRENSLERLRISQKAQNEKSTIRPTLRTNNFFTDSKQLSQVKEEKESQSIKSSSQKPIDSFGFKIPGAPLQNRKRRILQITGAKQFQNGCQQASQSDKSDKDQKTQFTQITSTSKQDNLDGKLQNQENSESQSELSKQMNEKVFANSNSRRLLKFLQPSQSSTMMEQNFMGNMTSPEDAEKKNCGQLTQKQRSQMSQLLSQDLSKVYETAQEHGAAVEEQKNESQEPIINSQNNNDLDLLKAQNKHFNFKSYNQLGVQDNSESKVGATSNQLPQDGNNDPRSSRMPSKNDAKQHYQHIQQMQKMMEQHAEIKNRSNKRRLLSEYQEFDQNATQKIQVSLQRERLPLQQVGTNQNQQSVKTVRETTENIQKSSQSIQKSGIHSSQSQNQLQLNTQQSLKIASQHSSAVSENKVKPYRFMKFTKQDRSKQLRFPIYLEKDVIQLDQQFEDLLDKNLCEQQQDDDVETDEEVLCSGIQQCHTDLRDLKIFIRNNKHFRAQSNVVQKWKRRGFTFSTDGRRNSCTLNFGCQNIF